MRALNQGSAAELPQPWPQGQRRDHVLVFVMWKLDRELLRPARIAKDQARLIARGSFCMADRTDNRLSAFEEWLRDSESGNPHSAPVKEMPPVSPVRERQEPAKLSKNKREQLEKEIAKLEKKIASVEAAIAELELCFQNPATGTDWESTHRRYADLKVLLETLYEDLARHWELMGQ